ncbi:MAG: serine hydrolase [Myxococcota bacterium]
MKRLLVGLLLVALLGCSGPLSPFTWLARARYQTSLFTGAPQHENFVRQADFYPTVSMQAAPTPRPFPRGPALALPEEFAWEGASLDVEAFLRDTDTAALLVLQDGAIVHEDYWLTGGADVPWLVHSVSKSVVSAAVWLARRDGAIRSVDEPISDYVPRLAGSGYEGVAIEDVLQMSSGIRWDEDYADADSDITRFGHTIFTGGSFDDFVAGCVAETEPGTRNRYTGMDTMALGMLVPAATGVPLAAYVERELWQALGAEDEAFWTTDGDGVPLALGGLNATARDLAKVGELYRRGGDWHGTQVLPAHWVEASTTATAPHLVPGPNPRSAHDMGYGYQWWLLEGDLGDYSAIGIYNQFVYVSPATRTVIVKLSANRRYAVDGVYQESETIALLRTIARHARAATALRPPS